MLIKEQNLLRREYTTEEEWGFFSFLLEKQKGKSRNIFFVNHGT